jgi:Rps23 Pro-64 3,4-dihydroxylase Tpa1-like proline 4-hydroxylase
MKIIDNFLPKAYQEALEGLLLNAGFAWYLNQKTASGHDFDIAKETATESPQFTHKFFYDGQSYSNHFNFLMPILHHLMLTENVDTTEIMRIKANLNIPVPNYPKGHHYAVHKDYPKDTGHITAIYYVNDSQGDTKFFSPSGEVIDKVSPKKGRLVYFDGDTYHAGCPPKDNLRCVINFNFMSKETK